MHEVKKGVIVTIFSINMKNLTYFVVETYTLASSINTDNDNLKNSLKLEQLDHNGPWTGRKFAT